MRHAKAMKWGKVCIAVCKLLHSVPSVDVCVCVCVCAFRQLARYKDAGSAKLLWRGSEGREREEGTGGKGHFTHF